MSLKLSMVNQISGGEPGMPRREWGGWGEKPENKARPKAVAGGSEAAAGPKTAAKSCETALGGCEAAVRSRAVRKVWPGAMAGSCGTRGAGDDDGKIVEVSR